MGGFRECGGPSTHLRSRSAGLSGSGSCSTCRVVYARGCVNPSSWRSGNHSRVGFTSLTNPTGGTPSSKKRKSSTWRREIPQKYANRGTMKLSPSLASNRSHSYRPPRMALACSTLRQTMYEGWKRGGKWGVVRWSGAELQQLFYCSYRCKTLAPCLIVFYSGTFMQTIIHLLF